MNDSAILAFDYGERMIGVAIGNGLTRSARPLTAIINRNTAARFAAVAQLLQAWQPTRLVVGLPLHPDGTEHEMTKQCRRFGNQLHGRFGLPVHWVDERYSSVEAARRVAPGSARGALDAEAACIILQQYFDARLDEPASAANQAAADSAIQPTRDRP